MSTPEPDLYGELMCPMADCTEALGVDFEGWQPLAPVDTADPRPEALALPSFTAASSVGWKVSCTAGHVILLPGETGCCDAGNGLIDGYCAHAPAAYDWSEEYRTFRAHDIVRLREVLSLLEGRS